MRRAPIRERIPMRPDEIERVLTNWIKQATEPPGMLGKDIEPAKWIVQMFLRWWREKASSYLGDAELAAGRIRDEMEKNGGGRKSQTGGRDGKNDPFKGGP